MRSIARYDSPLNCRSHALHLGRSTRTNSGHSVSGDSTESSTGTTIAVVSKHSFWSKARADKLRLKQPNWGDPFKYHGKFGEDFEVLRPAQCANASCKPRLRATWATPLGGRSLMDLNHDRHGSNILPQLYERVA